EDFMKSEKYKDEEITESARFCLGGFIRLIEGYTWGFVITPKENGNSDISLRSLPASVNVREMMERMGIGGGHNRAAGGTFTKYDGISVLKCIKQTLEWMSKNKPVID
ncbi:hypothetical protein KKG08_01675, partial [Patescibacteria group bacterium]|nr:hypothetical protein [Patescibacteria group bacterium]